MAARRKSASRAKPRRKAAGSRPKSAAKRGAKRRSSVAAAGRRKRTAAAPKRVGTKRPGVKRAQPGRVARPRGASQTRATAATPNGIGMRVQHMDYTSHAMDEVRRFYTEWLGFSRFEYDEQMQYLLVTTGASSSLGFMPPAPGPPEQWRPPREPNIYLIVENVDRTCHDLIQKGVTFEQAPTDMPWGHRVAVARDPEGRAVCLAETRDK